MSSLTHTQCVFLYLLLKYYSPSPSGKGKMTERGEKRFAHQMNPLALEGNNLDWVGDIPPQYVSRHRRKVQM
jgi:hypothetical protein